MGLPWCGFCSAPVALHALRQRLGSALHWLRCTHGSAQRSARRVRTPRCAAGGGRAGRPPAPWAASGGLAPHQPCPLQAVRSALHPACSAGRRGAVQLPMGIFRCRSNCAQISLATLPLPCRTAWRSTTRWTTTWLPTCTSLGRWVLIMEAGTGCSSRAAGQQGGYRAGCAPGSGWTAVGVAAARWWRSSGPVRHRSPASVAAGALLARA